MKESVRRALIRSGKLMHFFFTIGLFAAACRMGMPSDVLPEAVMLHFGTLVFVYAVLLLFSLRAYSAYNVGFTQIRILIYSQTLADLVSDGILYVVLVINHLRLISPIPFLVLLAAQFLLNCVYSWIANTAYFYCNKPLETAVVYRNETDLNRLKELDHYPQKYHVIRKIQNPADDVHTLLKELNGCEAVFVAGIPATLRNGVLKYCVENDIRCYVAPHVGDVILMGAKYMELFSVPVFRVMRTTPAIEYLMIKRGMDILFSFLGIVVFSPFLLLTVAAVKLYDGGPALYKQVRLTKDGRQFEILKFRSMRVNAEQDGVARLAAENDDRITPVGKVIRACRLDELPQLFNILRGDMSIVGPRPERPEIARQYEELIPAFSLRLQVKAGLTGLAQVYGKYNTDPYDKLRMDLMYINQMSVLQDIKLIFATVKVLFMKESTSGVMNGQTTAAASTGDQETERALK